MTMTSNIRLAIQITANKAIDLAVIDGSLSYSKAIALADGFGVNQADKLFSDSRNILASANEDIDLAGVLTDQYGLALTFAKVKGVFVFAKPTNTNNVRVGRGATNGFTGLFTGVSMSTDVLPGGFYAWVAPGAGVAVTPATGDLINVANPAAGTSIDYVIIVIGTSA